MVYFITVDEHGRVILPKEEFQKLLNDEYLRGKNDKNDIEAARAAGYQEGYNAGLKSNTLNDYSQYKTYPYSYISCDSNNLTIQGSTITAIDSSISTPNMATCDSSDATKSTSTKVVRKSEV